MSASDDIFAEWDLNFEEFENDEQKIEHIAKFIGNFHEWPELPPELQMVVVSHLDYVTRTRLSFCSKRDYEIVNSTPIQIISIEMTDTENSYYEISAERNNCVSVHIEFGYESINKTLLGLRFAQKENDTEISWIARPKNKRPRQKSVMRNGSNYHEESIKFVEKWLKQSRYSVKSMTINMMNWQPEESDIQFLNQCDKLQVRNRDENVLRWWLKKVRPNIEFLGLSKQREHNISSQLLSMEHFAQCKQLRILGRSDFTDEQFLRTSAFKISIECSTITDRALNQFIWEWVNGKTRDNFLSFSIWIDRTVVKDELVKNLEVRPWDEQFEEETGGFCFDWARFMGRQDCYQIMKYDGSGTSATLDLSYNCVAFAVTGRRMEYNGRVYTSYSIP